MAAGQADATRGKATSQTVKALLALRDLILSGELKRGERIAELSVVDRLGVSRTPLRMALVRLEEEGLLEALPTGGFIVKAFTERDIFDAIETRGTLEGLAARFAAERGVTTIGLSAFHRCLADLDELIGRGKLSEDDFSDYVDLNEQFHEMILAAADSPVLAHQLERASALPFASPSGFVMAQAVLPEALKILTIAQDQHRCVVEAIEAREGGRAEALMREHARLAKRNLILALRDRASFQLVPGAALIRQHGAG
ncbi:GntR family transcriptional regulator [Breoghania corrubedonensis]|uniref:GntR family transcriptional regulator n=1 Tax=Breoghania corrubedonensis TaxID=665038 RepID=A0A2T5VI78_9HYPH|nr:GntR family transcriptional regulator [Breoghania corrubedonensis]PTW63463.1 GntR family transcriptional regulator [Breoghania corrubedonensis]